MLPVLSDFILLAGGYEDHFNEKKLVEHASKQQIKTQHLQH